MPEDFDRLPAGLPPGRLVIPDPAFADGDLVTDPVLWVSDMPVPDAGSLWASLQRQHTWTGLWPLLLTGPQDLNGMLQLTLQTAGIDELEDTADGTAPLRPWQTGELAPVPPEQAAKLDAEAILASGWDLATGEGIDLGDDPIPGLPFRTWPGLAQPGPGSADPDQYAAALAAAPDGIVSLTGRQDPPHLGLVLAEDGAAAICACGWLSPAGGAAETAAVIRSWQHRFGARLCALGIDTLAASIARPPRTIGHALHLAAEHLAFYPGLADMTPLDEYAATLVGSHVWYFWWD